MSMNKIVDRDPNTTDPHFGLSRSADRRQPERAEL